MFLGKLSEISFMRTVNKKISNKTYGINPGVNVGKADELVVANCSSVKVFKDFEKYYFYKTLNKIYEKTTDIWGININIFINKDFPEKKLGHIVKNINELAKNNGIDILKMDVSVIEVEDIILSFTAMGRDEGFSDIENIKPGLDIVMVNSAGLGMAYILNCVKDDVIRKSFSETFYDECVMLKDMLNVYKIISSIKNKDIEYVHTVADGGVFSGIWELASPKKNGVSVDVKKIPVWQHVIEMAELFDINPYLCDGTGAVLALTKDGDKLVNDLIDEGFLASKIGVMMEGHDRVIVNQDEKRYLEPPREDQIYKIF